MKRKTFLVLLFAFVAIVALISSAAHLVPNDTPSGHFSPVIKVCNHVYTSVGACEKCGAVCKHTFTNDTCSVCGFICDHNSEDGVCDVCGVCVHFTGGMPSYTSNFDGTHTERRCCCYCDFCEEKVEYCDGSPCTLCGGIGNGGS